MARTAFTAPAHIVKQRNVNGNTATQPDSAPSLCYGGDGIQDDRLVWNRANSPNAAQIVGWYGGDAVIAVNAVPSTLSTVSMAAAQVPVAGTPLTLRNTNGLGLTVVTAANQITLLPSLNIPPVGALVVDGFPGYQRFGIRDITAFYDQTTALARNVQIQSVGNDSTATFLVSGADFYGYPQTERITGANVGTAQGKKAFKFVYSITPAGTLSGSNVSAGQGDVYGLPLRADQFGYVYIIYNGTTVTANTGFTVADTTNPATSTTGDVRGTYAVQSASNGTKRLEISVSPNIVALNTTPLSNGMFGVTPA